jgi:hypothetical protein
MLLYSETAIAWNMYTELGASLGKISNATQYFGLGSTDSSSSNTGFAGSVSFYIQASPRRFPVHLFLGLQDRMVFASIENPASNLAMNTLNVAARLEFFNRFYAGAGYAPITFKSVNGPMGLRNGGDTTAYFFEGGVIWRVIPELQIAATYSLEYGMLASGARSPSPSSEYGLRFRFPIFPYESKTGAGSDFDGYRYPFGIMK